MKMNGLLQWSAFGLILVGLFPSQSHVRLACNKLESHVSQSQGPALEQIISIAKDNDIPLGIVVENDTLCRDRLKLTVGDVNLGSLIDNINAQMRGYRLHIDHGTLILGPISENENTKRLLSTNLAYFRPDSSTMQGLSQYLWTYIRAAINPNEGSVTSVISNPDDPVISGFDMEGPVHVVNVLNKIVQQNSGGVWVLSGVPINWERSVIGNPIVIRDYYDGIGDVAVNACRIERN